MIPWNQFLFFNAPYRQNLHVIYRESATRSFYISWVKDKSTVDLQRFIILLLLVINCQKVVVDKNKLAFNKSHFYSMPYPLDRSSLNIFSGLSLSVYISCRWTVLGPSTFSLVFKNRDLMKMTLNDTSVHVKSEQSNLLLVGWNTSLLLLRDRLQKME